VPGVLLEKPVEEGEEYGKAIPRKGRPLLRGDNERKTAREMPRRENRSLENGEKKP